MKITLLLFLTLSLFAFENGVTYQCQAINRDNVDLSPEEQLQTQFTLYIKKDGSYLKTSRPLIYDLTKTKLDSQDKLYVAKVKSNGRLVYFKLKFTGNNTLLRYVSVPGFRNLISEYIVCAEK
jgi:hypothetical protein